MCRRASSRDNLARSLSCCCNEQPLRAAERGTNATGADRLDLPGSARLPARRNVRSQVSGSHDAGRARCRRRRHVSGLFDHGLDRAGSCRRPHQDRRARGRGVDPRGRRANVRRGRVGARAHRGTCRRSPRRRSFPTARAPGRRADPLAGSRIRRWRTRRCNIRRAHGCRDRCRRRYGGGALSEGRAARVALCRRASRAKLAARAERAFLVIWRSKLIGRRAARLGDIPLDRGGARRVSARDPIGVSPSCDTVRVRRVGRSHRLGCRRRAASCRETALGCARRVCQASMVIAWVPFRRGPRPIGGPAVARHVRARCTGARRRSHRAILTGERRAWLGGSVAVIKRRLERPLGCQADAERDAKRWVSGGGTHRSAS